MPNIEYILGILDNRVTKIFYQTGIRWVRVLIYTQLRLTTHINSYSSAHN